MEYYLNEYFVKSVGCLPTIMSSNMLIVDYNSGNSLLVMFAVLHNYHESQWQEVWLLFQINVAHRE